MSESSVPTPGEASPPPPPPPHPTSGTTLAQPAPTSARPSTFGVLRHTHFRNIWIAAFISSLGGWMEIVGVQWAMTKATLAPEWTAHSSLSAPIMMGYLGAAQLSPQLFLGLVGGVCADMFNRKTMLIITQAVRMVIAAVLCVLAFRGVISPWLLILLGGLDGCAMAFNIPAWQVLTPRLVPREELIAAITLNGLQFNLARALGPAIGGLLLSIPGQDNPWLLFLLNTISYLFILVAICFTPDAPAPEHPPGYSPWSLVREAWKYLLHHRAPLYLIIAISVFSMLATPLLRMMPIIVKQTYLPGKPEDIQERTYGILLGLMGVGAVIGALGLKRIPVWYPKHHFVPLSITCCGLCLCWYAFSTNMYVAGAAVLITGVFWMWSFNAAFSALQLLVDDRIRGRVLAICNTISFGAMALGAVGAGAIGELVAGKHDEGVGAHAGLGVCSIALVLVGAVMLTWRVPEIDGIAPGEPGYDKKPGLLRGILATTHRENHSRGA
ncbi:MAG: MFS transporter [Phycisphaerales bacterium]